MSSSTSTPSPLDLGPSESPPTPPISPLCLASFEDHRTLRLDPIIEHVKADHALPNLPQRARVSSVSSVSFKSNGRSPPTVSSRSKPASRIRGSSPPPASRFRHHVSFDNLTGGESTEKNTISFTLNVKHNGYQFKRRSRTFMVGINDDDYSDIALQWMLEELVDDGDEIICLRVVDKDAKVVNDRNMERKMYQKEANELMQRIQSRNDDNRAISIALEFAVGKVHATFQKMMQIYEPCMLIVGTRGRSLGGLQGLMTNRNSFSKWCLQYSPIPVVVVRPTEKRLKKKAKRDADPARQDYARILKESGIDEHETAHTLKNNDIAFLEPNDPATEAHAVAAALGLPTRFDTKLTPYDIEVVPPKKENSTEIGLLASDRPIPTASRSPSPTTPRKHSKLSAQLEVPTTASAGESSASEDEEDEDDDEEEGEFEAVPGHTLLSFAAKEKNRAYELEVEEALKKKNRLHQLEMEEAAALAIGRKGSTGSADTVSSTASASAPLDEEEENDADDDKS